MNKPISFKCGCLLLGLAVAGSATALGQTDQALPYAGGVTLGARFSDHVQESFVDVRWPDLKTPRDVLMLDLRGTFLESAEQEVNAGFVYRHLSPKESVILGANMYYDGRWTENDNFFNQLGVGLECLTRHVDVRANYYYPLEDEFVLNSTSRSTVEESETSGSRTMTRTTSYYSTYEEALEGFDFELGVWLPWISRAVPTAVYAGYFDFNSEYEDGFRGGKARIESRIHPRFVLDAEWFDDSALNGTDYFVGMRVDIPFCFWKKSSWKTAGGDPRALGRRMSEMVVRDFRIRTIVTHPVLVGQTQTEEVVNERSRPVAPDQPTNEEVVTPSEQSPHEPPPVVPPEEPDNPRYDEDGNIIL